METPTPPESSPGPKPDLTFTLVLAAVVLALTVLGETFLTRMAIDSVYALDGLSVFVISMTAGVAVPYVLHKGEERFPRLKIPYAILGMLSALSSVAAFVTLRKYASQVLAFKDVMVPDWLQHRMGLTSFIAFAALGFVAAIAGSQCIGVIDDHFKKQKDVPK